MGWQLFLKCKTSYNEIKHQYLKWKFKKIAHLAPTPMTLINLWHITTGKEISVQGEGDGTTCAVVNQV